MLVVSHYIQMISRLYPRVHCISTTSHHSRTAYAMQAAKVQKLRKEAAGTKNKDRFLKIQPYSFDAC